MRHRLRVATIVAVLAVAGCATSPFAERYDLVIRNGTVYDGSGGEPRHADVGVDGDRIVAIGDLAHVGARTTIDAKGMAVAPGFVATDGNQIVNIFGQIANGLDNPRLVN